MGSKTTPRGPEHVRAWSLFQADRIADAKSAYENICRNSRTDDGAWLMLGIIHARQRCYAEAESCLHQAITTNPGNFDAHVNLGLLCCQQGFYERALQYYRNAVKLEAGHADVWVQAGNVYARMDLLVDAEEHYRHALGLNPEHPLAAGNLANVLAYQGRPDEAIGLYQQALRSAPQAAGIHSNLLLCLHYSGKVATQAIFQAHREWAALYGRGVQPYAWSPAAFKVSGRLRIGYVSPDLREHSVAYFLEPLLSGHDRSKYAIFCYADLGAQDATTARLAGQVDGVRYTHGLSDDQVAALIRQDGIGVLVDLAGHTENNRLPVFLRRPAPVQMTYLGYPDTTGLDSVDFRITDRWADPPGQTEPLHTERLLRLGSGFLRFSPPQEAPEPGALPFDAAGYITFGSFNALTKITPSMLVLWAGLLKQLPGGRLLIKNRQLTDPRLRERLRQYYAALGISGERIQLFGRTSKSEHLAACAGVDIALDTYPYNGTTTSCDSLWMGIPVITLAGTTHVSRVGLSLLARVGLEEFVAHDEQHYTATALALAGDTQRLRALRAGLRERMKSTLCDAGSFCREIEAGYESAWNAWYRSRAGV